MENSFIYTSFLKDTVKLFRLVLSDKRTDYLITNEADQHSTQAAQEAFRPRWYVEQLHREVQQLTGIDQCQARLARIQRNHIACAFLVWNRLSFLAHQLRTSVYALKQNLLFVLPAFTSASYDLRKS